MSAALAFSHGANDAQKSVGVVAALLLADGRIDSARGADLGKLACAAALTLGTALGGWRIIRTVGQRIYRIHPVEGLVSQTRLDGRHLRRLARRRTDLDDAGRRLLGRRDRRRAPALAPRPLGARARRCCSHGS